MASSDESLNVKLETPKIDKTKCGMCDQRNHLVKFCSTCPTWLCANCVQGHKRLPALKSHQLSDDQTSQTPVYTHCPRHDRFFLTYYCRTCDSPVCADCRLGTDHMEHTFVDIDVKVSENKKLLEKGLTEKRKLKKEMERVKSETKSELAEADKQLSGYELEFKKIVEDRQKKNKETNVKYLEQLKDAIDDLEQKIHTATSIQQSMGTHQSVTDLSLMSAISDDVVKAKPSYDKSLTSVIGSLLQSNVYVMLEEIRSTGVAKKSCFTSVCSLRDDEGDKELSARVKRYLKTKPVDVYTHQTLHQLHTDRLSIVSNKWFESFKQWIESDQKPFPPCVEHCTEDSRLDNVVFLAPFDAQLLRAVFGCHQPLPTACTYSLQQLVQQQVQQQVAAANNTGRKKALNRRVNDTTNKLHVFQIRKIKSIGDVGGSVETKIFHWNETVCEQNAQVYYNGKDVTEHVAGQTISSFFYSLPQSDLCMNCGSSLSNGYCNSCGSWSAAYVQQPPVYGSRGYRGAAGVQQGSVFELHQYSELCIKEP